MILELPCSRLCKPNRPTPPGLPEEWPEITFGAKGRKAKGSWVRGLMPDSRRLACPCSC